LKKPVCFPIEDFTEFKIKMLNWAQPFNIFCFLDNSGYNFESPAFECLLAAGSRRNIVLNAGNVFNSLKDFNRSQDDWIFGHFGYDLKNETEQLSSGNPDGIGFGDCHFFNPAVVVQLQKSSVLIYTDDNATSIFQSIASQRPGILPEVKLPVQISSRLSADDYTSIIQELKRHILRGDCYEVNFCQEFYATGAVISPIRVYDSLARLSPNPFSAMYRFGDQFCMCASPERYFKTSGRKIISQPIKGTSPRDFTDQRRDEQNRRSLIESEKEKSENVMIVDLVRNDLSRVCREGSVRVEELFGIYSFPQVHQMISTVSGDLEDGIDWIDVVKATFPMGSMTGAPKRRVMELIEEYEQTKRGLFSGAIGYVDPSGDANFNVVIRSILYNAATKYLSFQAGGAITFYSDPEEEYKECLLKVAAMRQVLE
jgi:para-aminobenzoate synthetase component 1